MRRDSSILFKWQVVVLAIVLLGFGFLEPAYSQATEAVIFLQKTPAGGGIITPDIGIHKFDLYRDVTLKAVPKPGYRFVYWLGDVIDPTANRTDSYGGTRQKFCLEFPRR